MKNKLLLILFIILGFKILNAQWISQYPHTLGLQFRDVEFINQYTGWICGDGVILKTTNMGNNWIIQNQPATNKYLFNISPIDSNVVYCVGWFETVLKTTDGGNNWLALKNGPIGQGHSYDAVFFVNANTGWYGGTGNHIYKTTNGGITFDSIYVLGGFMDMHFKDINTGLITGGGGEIFKTTNSGLNWNRIYLTGDGFGDFKKISVINNQYCFVVENEGYKRVFRSTNYGDTWDSIGYVAGAHHSLYIGFSSLNTGWVGDESGYLYKSTTGGTTWTLNDSGIQGNLSSFWFFNDLTGWVVGSNGALLFTSTGGVTFERNIEIKIPDDFILYQNHPNPFNNETIISYSIPQKSYVKIILFDMLGRKVDEIYNGIKNSGTHSEIYNASKLSSGIYFVKIILDNKIQKIKSMILIK
jgi:photosystem II stability/assembly factor-like uncharacterized protein